MRSGKIIILIFLLVLGAGLWWFSRAAPAGVPEEVARTQTEESGSRDTARLPAAADEDSLTNATVEDVSIDASSFIPPLVDIAERITKKPFGIYITPATSPVQPERFQGYHTGADFEILPDEEDAAVEVHAVCTGELVLKRTASGYGGVAAQRCALEGMPIVVLYGHLKLASITHTLNEEIIAGDVIGVLGAAGSLETDGERKHLHLGLVKGSTVDLRGYVGTHAALEGWIDPCQYMCDI